MTKTMHLRWLRLRRQTRLTGPRAAQRRTAPWATLPIFTELMLARPSGSPDVPEALR